MILEEDESLSRLSRHVFAMNRHVQQFKNVQSIMGSHNDMGDSLPSISPRQHQELQDKMDHHSDKIEHHWGAIQRIKGNRQNWSQEALDSMNVAKMGAEISHEIDQT